MVIDLLKKGGDPLKINELKKRYMKPIPFMLIADVINMFRLVGVCVSIKSPLAPLFERGGEHLHSGIARCDHWCSDMASGLHKFPL